MKKIDQERTFAGGIEFAIRLAVLGLLLYWSFVLVRPFVTIVIWSTVLTVALYPPFDWLASHLGGRRRLAAFIITIASLLIVIGPATWLVLNLIDSLRTLAERLDWTTIALPRPPEAVKAWPLIGDQIYQLWDLASTNLRAALTKIAPQLKPVGGGLLRIAAGAGISAVQFFVSIIVAGFLFCPAPSMVRGIKTFAGKLCIGPSRGVCRSCRSDDSRRLARGHRNFRVAGASDRDRLRTVWGSCGEPADVRRAHFRNHSNWASPSRLSGCDLGLDDDGNDDGVSVYRLYGSRELVG